MDNKTTPYLCGGTFLTQILRARKDLASSTEHTNGQKESLSEQETFRRLISIYQLSNFYGGTSLKPPWRLMDNFLIMIDIGHLTKM